MRKTLLILCVMIVSCVSAQRIEVANMYDFELGRYLGTWYEIARLDHRFERGMTNVTANYTLRSDGKIQVLNRGFSAPKQEWRESKAVAKITDIPNKFKLYFLPFIAGSYNVAYVDSDYSIAVVSGGSSRYLWFLSREPHVSLEQRDTMIAVARALGYNTTDLIYVNQD